MTLPVFVVDADALGNDVIEITGDEGRHAAVVRRIRAGERIALTDGAGNGADCVVRSVSKRLLTAEVLLRRVEPPPSLRLVVVQALVKGDAAVDLMTQVGVDAIVPWSAARSVLSWNADRSEPGARALERWRSTAREAGKQSRRLRFPTVEPLHSTEQVVALLRAAANAVVLHEGADEPVNAVAVPANGDLVVLVGPEGGLSGDELVGFSAAGAKPVRLGPSVLRASTAGAVAAGVLLSRSDRWG